MHFTSYVSFPLRLRKIMSFVCFSVTINFKQQGNLENNHFIIFVPHRDNTQPCTLMSFTLAFELRCTSWS